MSKAAVCHNFGFMRAALIKTWHALAGETPEKTADDP